MAKTTKKQNIKQDNEVFEVKEKVNNTEDTIKDELIQNLLREIENLKAQIAQQKQQNTKTEVRDLHELVPCRSVVVGKLVYKSPKSFGYTVTWNNFGDVEYLELGELIAMRNAYPRFFSEPWIIIDDVDIIKYLNVEKYYKNIIDVDNIEAVFKQPVDKFIDTLQKVPRGLKHLITHKAIELIKEGKLDSLAKIKAIEQTFNVDLSIAT